MPARKTINHGSACGGILRRHCRNHWAPGDADDKVSGAETLGMPQGRAKLNRMEPSPALGARRARPPRHTATPRQRARWGLSSCPGRTAGPSLALTIPEPPAQRGSNKPKSQKKKKPLLAINTPSLKLRINCFPSPHRKYAETGSQNTELNRWKQ